MQGCFFFLRCYVDIELGSGDAVMAQDMRDGKHVGLHVQQEGSAGVSRRMEGDGLAAYTVFREPCFQMLVQVIGREMGEKGRVTVFVFLFQNLQRFFR